jgi:hypothetical protein
MKDIKIGASTFKPKAMRIIALCFLFNVATIGAIVALKNGGSSLSIFIIYPLLFMPYLFGIKGIRDNVITATSNKS